jgi:sulfide dehydrogenase cytochrome subunit
MARGETVMKYLQICLLALVAGVTGMVLASDIGELTPQCDSCHGSQGASLNSDVPTIGGQSREYISSTMKSFQIWGRPCIKSLYRHGDTSRPKTDMCKIADGLSNEDIDALSNHYGELPFIPARQEFDASRLVDGATLHEQYCERCHEQGGSAAGRGPRLAGQWVTYMKATLKYVPTGEHQVPPMMERGLGKFSNEEIDSLLNYYASQQGRE